MRVVLDTNVIISALFFDGLPDKLMAMAIAGEFRQVTSPFILTEVERVLMQKFGLAPMTALLSRREVEVNSSVVQPEAIPPVSRDPDDDEILATAVAGGAEYIVTGDKDLLVIGRYGDIDIMTPREFMTALDALS